jgi:hypothetical protein
MKATLSIVAGLLCFSHIQAATGAALSWKTTGDSLALLQGEQVVWQFNHGTNTTKPCFHPVALPGGPVLTWDRPQDHPWHRALWFSWKFINGINYWEEDAKTGLPAGLTEWTAPKIEAKPDFSGRIVLDLSYRPAAGKPVLTEHRIVEISAPDSQGIYRQDWTMTFTAQGQDVKLDRTPLPDEPDGKPYGGYAGLSVRFVKDFGSIRAVTTQGAIEFKESRFRGKSAALDYSGVIENREAGIAILDHPKNLNAPSPWYAIHEPVMHYFSPAVLCYQPHILKAGQSVTLRYRVLVHPGYWDATRLQQECKRYADSPVSPAAARPKLIKLPVAIGPDAMENTPIIFDSRPMLVLNRRDDTKNKTDGYTRSMYLYVMDLTTGKEIARFGEGHSFANAFVNGAELNVFASEGSNRDWFQSLYRFSTTDLKTWKRELAIPQADGEHLFNASVCRDEKGFLMAYESDKPVTFCFKFARSATLSDWKKLDGLAFTGVGGEYSACPVLRYIAPYYYVIYLHAAVPGHKGWVPFLARSKDLSDWDLSPFNPILEASAGEGVNNSDVDLFEYEGNTYLYYATGDQQSWGSVRIAMYAGSMREFFTGNFPAGEPMIRISTRKP